MLSRRANQSNTKGTYSHVAKAVRRRYGNKIASFGKARRTTTRPGYRKTTRRHRRKKYGGAGLMTVPPFTGATYASRDPGSGRSVITASSAGS